MANIRKQSKRWRWLPRVTDGYVTIGEHYAEYPEGDVRRMIGGMPPMMQTLDVTAGSGGSDRVEYQLQLTEDEAIRVAGEWLTQIARRRAKVAADAKAKAVTS